MPPLPQLLDRDSVLFTAWSVFLALVLTWPMILDPAGQALGSASADGMKHLWTLWWMRASVWTEGVFPFATHLVNWPTGMELYPIEPLGGLAAVLTPGLDIVLLSNALVLLNLVATGVAGAWFGRVISGTRIGGLLAGTVLEGSAVMAFFVHVGVGELTHLWWLPLGLGVLERAAQSTRQRHTGWTHGWGWFGALASCLVGAVLSCFYLGFFLALAVAIRATTTLLSTTLLRRDWLQRGGLLRGGLPRLLVGYTLAAAVSIAVVWPVTQTFSTSYRAGDVPRIGLKAYLLEDHGQPVTDPPSARLEPSQLVVPGRAADSREEHAYGGGRYLGWIVLVLAVVGLARRPREGLPWLVVGATGAVLATGTFLTVDGAAVEMGGARLRMPMFWLNRVLGYVAEPLNFPSRALALTTVALAALVARAASDVTGHGRWVLALAVPLIVVETAWGQMLPWPWERFSPRPAAALETLTLETQQEAPDGAVLDLALAVRSDHENRWNALSTQIAHGKPVQSVPIERIEYFARDGAFFVSALELVTALTPLYENRGGALDGDYRGDIAILRDAGFRWILVSYRNGREQIPTDLTRGLSELCGRPPVARQVGLEIFELPDVRHTDAELAQWKEKHAQAVAVKARMTPGMGPPR